MAEFSDKYSSSKKKPGKTKAFFICLLIASFLWLAHALNTVYTYTLRIPVTFKNVPADKMPLSQLPEMLTVEVKASGLKISLILLSKPFKTYDIDFNTLKSTNRNQNFVIAPTGRDLRHVLKFETQVKQVSPDTLYFTEKTGFQRNVPVHVPMYIRCADGFGYRKPQITPAFVTILGDTNVISRVDTMYTQPLSLSNVNRSVDADLTLVKPNDEVYVSSTQVKVHIEVSRLIEHVVYVNVTDVQNTPGKQVNIYPRRVKVRFTVPEDAFVPEDTLLFRATINSLHRSRRTSRTLVSLSTVPGNVTVLSIEPPEVETLILKK